MDKSDLYNDQVVRVTAARKFKDIADEWEFKADIFLPYAPVTLDRLMALVQEVELPETKMVRTVPRKSRAKLRTLEILDHFAFADNSDGRLYSTLSA